MTPEEAIARIAQSTAQGGFVTSNDAIRGVPVLVARTSQFRLRWVATTLQEIAARHVTFAIGGRAADG